MEKVGKAEAVYVVELSPIIDGTLKERILEGAIRGRVLVPAELVDYLEYISRSGDDMGTIGLKELQDIRDAVEKLGLAEIVTLETVGMSRGHVPRDERELSNMVRRAARESGLVVITSDPLSRDAALAGGLPVMYIGKEKQLLEIEKYFEKNVMSVHLKEGVPPKAKVGRPGDWKIVDLSPIPMDRHTLEMIVRELVSESLRSARTKVEIRRPHSMVIQHKEYRIVVAFPPVSDGLEITAVRPLVKKSLDEYNLDVKLVERLEKSAEGVLISGPPGAGKTTFAQALAEFYLGKGKVVKTIESPRDMVLPVEVTQLSKALATSEELHDLLLLSRPDYTIFDEMRDTADFQLFIDLRLAGVGMVGVIHATSPIDSIQRFIGRVELGMLPSIVDTVIFMRDGRVIKAYALEMTVKVPAGLREEDLARPVILIKDFLTEEVEYEIYVFGEETFVVPVKRAVPIRHVDKRIASAIVSTLKRYVPPRDVSIERSDDGALIIKVPEEYLHVVLSRGMNKLEKIRRKYHVDLRVESH